MSRVVAVTGASGGIGRATALDFARLGDRVALLARGEAGLEATEKEIRDLGVDVLRVPTDVADPRALSEAVDQIERRLGPIDVWVNVAFSSAFSRFTDLTAEEFRRATEVTYLGYVYATMAVLPRMLERNRGVIVQVGSALAYRGIPLQTAYCGAKHAIQGFHEALRCELLHDRSKVHVTMVQMPAVNTPQFSWLVNKLPQQAQPVPPIYQPEVAARAVVFAADHPGRREYWVGASTVATLLANAVVPGLLDRYLARTGFHSQQTGEPKDPDQPGNLWAPADGPDGHDYGAHGRFDARSTGCSAQQWLSHRYPALAGGAAVLGAAAAWTVRRGLR